MIEESKVIEETRLAAPWSRKELWTGFALALFLYLSLSLLAGLVGQWLGWTASPRLGLLLFAIQLLMTLPALLIMGRYGSLATRLGMQRFSGRMLAETLAMTALGFLGSMVWGLFLYQFGLQAQEPVIPLFGEGLGALASLLFVGGFVAPLLEEVLFRGFLFAGLIRPGGLWKAILLSAAIFGAIHLQPLAFPALFWLGALLALLYHRTGSLWAPILMHTIINSTAIMAQFVAAQQGLL